MRGSKILTPFAITLAIASVLVGSALSQNLKSAIASTDIFTATLGGDKEVPPVQTNATGSIGFSQPHLNNMSYGLQVENLANITAAHIHIGKEGANGPVVVTLFKADNDTGTGLLNGQLAKGAIMNNMLEGPLAGKAVESDLVNAIKSGEAYVNVHTVDHPDGAIRGQIIAPVQ
jgi:hypothetical protein